MGWDPPSNFGSVKGKQSIDHTAGHGTFACMRKSQKCHPDSNGETVKRRSPVCVYLTSKGTESRTCDHFGAGLTKPDRLEMLCEHLPDGLHSAV